MEEQNQQSAVSSQPKISQEQSNKSYISNWKKWIPVYILIAILLYGGVYLLLSSKKKTSPYSPITSTPTITTEISPSPSIGQTQNAMYLTLSEWKIRLPISSILTNLKAGNPEVSSYSPTDQAVKIIAPQLDIKWDCVADADGTKATIGSISRTTNTKRSGPYAPLVTKKIGNYTYSYEATPTSNCTNDPLYQELVKEFQSLFNTLESY